MPAFTRTIIVLDQASGVLRVDDDRLVGVDLDPAAAGWVERQAVDGHQTVLLLTSGAPADVDASAVEQAGSDQGRLRGIARAVGVTEVANLDDGPSAAGLLGAGKAMDEPTGRLTAFVSADRRLRGRARAEGLHPVAHPAVLPLLAKAGAVVAARFAGPRPVLERFAVTHGVVPLHWQPAPGGSDWGLIGICEPGSIADALLRRLSVVPLDYDPAVDDVAWVRIDPGTEGSHAGLAGLRVLYAEPGQTLVALGPEDSGEEANLHGVHGHTELLAPDPGLLQPGLAEAGPDLAAMAPDGGSPILDEVVIDEADRRLILTARLKCAVATRGYAGRLDRYTGAAALDGAGPIVSRHTAHPDNKRVEARLLADLRTMGYCPWRHDFRFAGATHSNIIADLPGRGQFQLKPAVLERLRRILGSDDARDAIRAELRALDGQAAAADVDDLPEPLLRRELERILALQPWNPWWRLKCPMAGLGAGLVIVGAHLDSTAGFDPGYSPASDPAPGRDDNGSGLAAVLTLAQDLRRLAGRLTHTIRFCFFNAEESGLVGSKAYASQLKAQRAPVRAVFCLDMIGYNSDAARIFELHAGYTDPVIRDLSVPLASQVAAAAAETGALLPAQIYRGTGYGGAPDRDLYDGAINRSDHAAFQQQGWGAVLASEDFFVNLASEPVADANPDYHRSSDQTVDVSFARAITCAVGRAATLAAL